MNEVKIREGDEYIELGNLLKILDVIYTGGEAKTYLMDNDVYVNDEIERRRGRKLYPNDVIRISKKEYIIKKS